MTELNYFTKRQMISEIFRMISEKISSLSKNSEKIKIEIEILFALPDIFSLIISSYTTNKEEYDKALYEIYDFLKHGKNSTDISFFNSMTFQDLTINETIDLSYDFLKKDSEINEFMELFKGKEEFKNAIDYLIKLNDGNIVFNEENETELITNFVNNFKSLSDFKKFGIYYNSGIDKKYDLNRITKIMRNKRTSQEYHDYVAETLDSVDLTLPPWLKNSSTTAPVIMEDTMFILATEPIILKRNTSKCFFDLCYRFILLSYQYAQYVLNKTMNTNFNTVDVRLFISSYHFKDYNVAASKEWLNICEMIKRSPKKNVPPQHFLFVHETETDNKTLKKSLIQLNNQFSNFVLDILDSWDIFINNASKKYKQNPDKFEKWITDMLGAYAVRDSLLKNENLLKSINFVDMNTSDDFTENVYKKIKKAVKNHITPELADILLKANEELEILRHSVHRIAEDKRQKKALEYFKKNKHIFKILKYDDIRKEKFYLSGGNKAKFLRRQVLYNVAERLGKDIPGSRITRELGFKE